MSDHPQDKRSAVVRAVRVSDQSCTAYAHLRDKYRHWAFMLDAAILLLSGWLSAMVFVKSEIARELTPFDVSSELWIGLLSIFAFALSLLQLLVNWKGRAESYQQALMALSAFTKEYRPLLNSLTEEQAQFVIARYIVITDGLEPIPERFFLPLKRKHLVKVELSRVLHERPGASLWLQRVKIAFRDNWCSEKRKSEISGK